MSDTTSDERMGQFVALMFIIGFFGFVIIEVFKMLITVAIIGSIGTLLYKVEQESGGISRLFSNLTNTANDALENRTGSKRRKPQGLPEGQEDPLLGSIEKLVLSMDTMNSRMEKQDNMLAKMEETLTSKIEQIVDEKLQGVKKEQLDLFFDDKNK